MVQVVQRATGILVLAIVVIFALDFDHVAYGILLANSGWFLTPILVTMASIATVLGIIRLIRRELRR
jgi:hypothetical protein